MKQPVGGAVTQQFHNHCSASSVVVQLYEVIILYYSYKGPFLVTLSEMCTFNYYMFITD